MRKSWIAVRKGNSWVVSNQVDYETNAFSSTEAFFTAWLYNACDKFQDTLSTKARMMEDTFRIRVNFAIKLILTRNRIIFNQRAFDDCFEMNDGTAVIQEILSKAFKMPALQNALKELKLHESWGSGYGSQVSQANLF